MNEKPPEIPYRLQLFQTTLEKLRIHFPFENKGLYKFIQKKQKQGSVLILMPKELQKSTLRQQIFIGSFIYQKNISMFVQLEYNQMRNCNQRGKCAYLRPSKSTSKNDQNSLQLSQTPSLASQNFNHLYDHLMNSLECEDSLYIERLCRKSQSKIKKNFQNMQILPSKEPFLEIMNFPSSNLSTNNQIDQKISSPKSPFIHSSKSNAQQVSYQRVNDYLLQKGQKKSKKISQNNSLSNQIQHQKSFNSSFIDDIDQHIAIINKNLARMTPKHNQQQFQKESSLQSTFQNSNNRQNHSKNSLISLKYQHILGKLEQEQLQTKLLQNKIKRKNAMLNKMGVIAQSMHHYILELREQLQAQNEEKRKYISTTQEFINKISCIEKKSNLHCEGRNGKTLNEVFYYSQLEDTRNNFTTTTTNIYNLKKIDSGKLKKKVKQHKGYYSENLTKESELPSNNSSIYYDSYLTRQQ